MHYVITAIVVVVLGVILLFFSGMPGGGSNNSSTPDANSEKTLKALIKEVPQEIPVATPKISKISIEYVESEQKHYLIFDNSEKKQFQNKNELDQILAEALPTFAEKVEFVSFDEDEYRDVVETFLRTHNKR